MWKLLKTRVLMIFAWLIIASSLPLLLQIRLVFLLSILLYLICVLAAVQIGLPQIMGQQNYKWYFFTGLEFCYLPPPPMSSFQLEPTPFTDREVETGAEILLKLGKNARPLRVIKKLIIFINLDMLQIWRPITWASLVQSIVKYLSGGPPHMPYLWVPLVQGGAIFTLLNVGWIHRQDTIIFRENMNRLCLKQSKPLLLCDFFLAGRAFYKSKNEKY